MGYQYVIKEYFGEGAHFDHRLLCRRLFCSSQSSHELQQYCSWIMPGCYRLTEAGSWDRRLYDSTGYRLDHQCNQELFPTHRNFGPKISTNSTSPPKACPPINTCAMIPLSAWNFTLPQQFCQCYSSRGTKITCNIQVKKEIQVVSFSNI